MPSKRLEFGDFSALTGISNDSYDATIKNLTIASENSFAQLVPLRIVAGFNHVFTALEHALSAFELGSAFARKPELEFIIRLCAEKQLNRALEIAEFGKEPLLLVAKSGEIKKIARGIGFVGKKFEIGKNKAELMKIFGISKRELEAMKDSKSALEELVIEKCALVALEK